MRWLLWCFCLLAESYETINHYHYQLFLTPTASKKAKLVKFVVKITNLEALTLMLTPR